MSKLELNPEQTPERIGIPESDQAELNADFEDSIVESVMFDDVPVLSVSEKDDGTVQIPAPLESELPVVEPYETDAEMADAIAKLISAAYPSDDAGQTVMQPDAESVPPETEALQSAAPQQGAAAEAVPQSNTQYVSPQTEASEPVMESNVSGSDEAEKPTEKTAVKKKWLTRKSKDSQSQEPKEAPAVNSAQIHKKIPHSRIRFGFVESLVLMLGDIRARRWQDLPDEQASLRSREAYYAKQSGISTILAPVRYVILVLLVFSLMGRRFRWMLLGFLGGTTGVYVCTVLTILAMIASFRSLFQSVRDMAFLRFSFESLLLIVTILSALEAISQQNSSTLIPILGIGWCLCGTADLMELRGKRRSVRNVLSGKTNTGLRMAPGLWKKMDCIGKAPSRLNGFIRHLEMTDSFHSGWSIYAPIHLIVAVIVSAYLTAKTAGNYVTILVTLLTISLPVAALLCCARPLELLTRFLGRRGALAGWYGVKVLSGRKTMLIYDTDLFPVGAIVHHGMKVYGQQTSRLLASYGASMVLQAGIGLDAPFTKLLNEAGGQIYHVSHLQKNEGGLSGTINGVPVLLGTYNYLQLMGIVIPQYAPRNGLFIAINGSIAGQFAMKYRVSTKSIQRFANLVQDRRLTLAAATKNISVNPAYLENWFMIPVGEILCPKANTRFKLSEPTMFKRGITCGYLADGNFLTYSRMVSGARRVHRTGMIMTILSILCAASLLFYSVHCISQGVDLISTTGILLIQLTLFALTEIMSWTAVR